MRKSQDARRPINRDLAPSVPASNFALYVLEATVEILKTENEILKRRLAAAETWAAQAVTRHLCYPPSWARTYRPVKRDG